MPTTPTSTPARAARILRAVAIAVGLTLLATSCHGYSGRQQTVRKLVNNTRANWSPPRRRLPMHHAAAVKAQDWARELARCRCLKHSRLSSGLPRGWRSIGENVGRSGDGGTLKQVHRSFMRSRTHRDNIIAKRWTDIGTGVAVRGTEKFVVQVFVQY